MNDQKQRIQLWIAALRSGKYVQAKNRLRQSTGAGFGYCCLGVACELADIGYWVNNPCMYAIDNYSGSGTYLIPEILTYYGIDQETELILADMNDKQDKDFGAIANYIEEKYL